MHVFIYACVIYNHEIHEEEDIFHINFFLHLTLKKKTHEKLRCQWYIRFANRLSFIMDEIFKFGPILWVLGTSNGMARGPPLRSFGMCPDSWYICLTTSESFDGTGAAHVLEVSSIQWFVEITGFSLDLLLVS